MLFLFFSHHAHIHTPLHVYIIQSTGNMFILSGNLIQPFVFKYCYNDSTKYKFIDFTEANFYIELDFKPTRLEVAENIFAAMNQMYVNVFQIIGAASSVWNNSSNEASTSSLIASGKEMR